MKKLWYIYIHTHTYIHTMKYYSATHTQNEEILGTSLTVQWLGLWGRGLLLLLLLSRFSHVQLCATPQTANPPGSPVPGILQATTLEWVAISFSSAWKWKVKVKLLSHVRSSATPWTAAYQAPLSMGFSRQEYWSGVPLPSPEVGGRLRKSCHLQQYWWALGAVR